MPGERLFIPELLRLRGELRAAGGVDAAVVEADFRAAIALAREMGAKLRELRAATSLARYLGQHGRIVGTRDLVEAKALLDEIGERV